MRYNKTQVQGKGALPHLTPAHISSASAIITVFADAGCRRL
ncbi:hypothetical protein HMPREF9248_0831 [Fannyhessea vaginae PB189-T1-4]|uniref:Uncharacterized protein n=1 Tax=Fannyhessea vaginae PB189-T1-4 TaxID=866774 RepID=A0ABP2J022_9ACTN|nr:hypothetical protein HMPREF9248_0831 [Fannyhessea vaginae PB189-T1-4]